MVSATVAETWTAISTTVLSGTSIVALIFAMAQLRQGRQSDRIKHLLTLVNEFECDPIAGYRRETARKRIAGEDYPAEAQDLLNFFETIGLLVKRKYLDVHDVWDIFAYWMFNIYSDFRVDIEQEQREDETYYKNFCTLIDKLRKIEQSEHGTSDRPSPEEIMEFWEEEAKAPAPHKQRKRRKAAVQPMQSA
jgi:hypothetical protein